MYVNVCVSCLNSSESTQHVDKQATTKSTNHSGPISHISHIPRTPALVQAAEQARREEVTHDGRHDAHGRRLPAGHGGRRFSPCLSIIMQWSMRAVLSLIGRAVHIWTG